MFVDAQLSDLHVNGTHRNRARIEAAFDYVNSRRRHRRAGFVTGDLTDHGSAEMLEARKRDRQSLPTLITIGNHDAPTFNEVFGPGTDLEHRTGQRGRRPSTA